MSCIMGKFERIASIAIIVIGVCLVLFLGYRAFFWHDPWPPLSLQRLALGCRDGNPLSGVPDHDQLKVIDRCQIVTGMVDSITSQPDGDLHIALKPDTQYTSYLSTGNRENQNGELLAEAICENEPNQTVQKADCSGFVLPNFEIPKVGDHITVVGPYVNDLTNGWSEIHPIWKLEILRN